MTVTYAFKAFNYVMYTTRWQPEVSPGGLTVGIEDANPDEKKNVQIKQ